MKSFKVFWFLGLWFLAFSVSWFLGSWFLGSLVSKFQSFKVQKFQSYKVSTLQKSISCVWFILIPYYQMSISCFWRILIPHQRFLRIHYSFRRDVSVTVFSSISNMFYFRSFEIFEHIIFTSASGYFLNCFECHRVSKDKYD